MLTLILAHALNGQLITSQTFISNEKNFPKTFSRCEKLENSQDVCLLKQRSDRDKNIMIYTDLRTMQQFTLKTS